MSLLSNLSISKTIDYNKNCSIIPVLLTQLKDKTLFKYVSNYIPIPETYTQLLNSIEVNMKENNLGMASLTIEYNNKIQVLQNNNTILKTKKKILKIKGSKKKANTNQNNIHQLFIIPINHKVDGKSTTTYNDELLELARVSGNAIFNRLKNNQISRVNIIDTIDTVSGDTTYLEAIMEGLLLSSYRFLKYKTTGSLTKSQDKFNIKSIHLVVPLYNRQVHKDTVIYKIKHLLNQIKSVFLTRDLINEPANDGKGTLFIEIVKKYIKENKIPVVLKVLDKAEIEKMGMGLILGVGKASTKINEPQFLILKYNGNRKSQRQSQSKSKTKYHKEQKSQKEKIKGNPEYVLLGKGITFDTGGTNLKKASSMYDMKTDMSGAAIVISFLLGYAMNNGNKSIYAMCPLVENSIGSGGIKPSDVLTAYGGKTVEVSNTDAEGRLILADCLAYVSETYPKATIIDFATLTGQQESLSCKMFSNILSVNSEIEVSKLIEKGKHINELLVELPIMDKHLNKLESYVADIKNISFNCSADIIMSSLFMKQFINKNTKWIHIDIAGQSYKANEIIKYASPEASGIGVRLLFAFLNE